MKVITGLAAVFPLLLFAACSGGTSDLDNDGVANAADCAPRDSQAWQVLLFDARDADQDGFRAPKSGQVCTGAALPADLFATLSAPADWDCDDSDATRWRNLRFMARDNDGDGYRADESGTWCGQDVLPPNLFAVTTPQSLVDCDDAAANRWNWVAYYRDADGDGTGSGSPIRACLGNTLPGGYSSTGYDPSDDPNDPGAATITKADLPVALLAVPDDTEDN